MPKSVDVADFAAKLARSRSGSTGAAPSLPMRSASNGVRLTGPLLQGISLHGAGPNGIGVSVGGHNGIGLNGQVVAIEL